MKLMRYYILALVLVLALLDGYGSASYGAVGVETDVRQRKSKHSTREKSMAADSLSLEVGGKAVGDSLPKADLGNAEPLVVDTTISPSKTRRRDRIAAATDTTSRATKPTEEELGSLEKEWPKVVFKHYVGVKGGYGLGSGRFEPTRENELHLGLYNFGLTYMFDAVSKGNKYVGAVQLELEYLQKGFTYHPYRDSEDVMSRDYAVIQIPLLWQPYIPLSKNGYSRFFINAGPFVNYIIDTGSERKYNLKTGATIQSGPYKWDPMRDNRFEYGLAAGAGFKIGIRRFAVTLEFRYNITFSDLMKGVEKYPSNTFFRSPIDQMNLSLMLIYRLTK